MLITLSISINFCCVWKLKGIRNVGGGDWLYNGRGRKVVLIIICCIEELLLGANFDEASIIVCLVSFRQSELLLAVSIDMVDLIRKVECLSFWSACNEDEDVSQNYISFAHSLDYDLWLHSDQIESLFINLPLIIKFSFICASCILFFNLSDNVVPNYYLFQVWLKGDPWKSSMIVRELLTVPWMNADLLFPTYKEMSICLQLLTLKWPTSYLKICVMRYSSPMI